MIHSDRLNLPPPQLDYKGGMNFGKRSDRIKQHLRKAKQSPTIKVCSKQSLDLKLGIVELPVF
jgi:hypothetical protein